MKKLNLMAMSAVLMSIVIAPAVGFGQYWQSYGLTAGENDTAVAVVADPVVGPGHINCVYAAVNSVNADNETEVVVLWWNPLHNQLLEWHYASSSGMDVRAVGLAVDATEQAIYVAAGADNQYVTLKFDAQYPNTDPLWEEWFGPGDDINSPVAIALRQGDGEKDVVVTGVSRSNSSPRGFDYCTVCYGPDGDEPLWSAVTDGEMNLDDSVTALAVDEDGDVYVTGKSVQSLQAPRDERVWTIRYNGEDGTIATNWPHKLPQTGTDNKGVDIAVGTEYVYVTGRVKSAYDYNVLMIRYDKDNPANPATAVYGEQGQADQVPVDMALRRTDDGDTVYVVAYENSQSPARTRARMLKYDQDLNLLWSQHRTVSNAVDTVTAIAIDGEEVFVTGRTDASFAYVNRYTPTGVPLVFWPLRHDLGDYPTAMATLGMTGWVTVVGAVTQPVGATATTTDAFLAMYQTQDPTVGWKGRADVPLLPHPRDNKLVKDGGCLAATTEEGDDYVYALKGNNTVEFYRNDPGDDIWVSKESIPAVGSSGKKKLVKKGGSLAAAPSIGKVYATKGNNTLEFWEYDPNSTVGYKWKQKLDVPAGVNTVSAGAAAVGVDLSGSPQVFLLKGKRTREFYRYDAVAGTWSTMEEAPEGDCNKGFGDGSCICYDPGSGTIYALKGTYREFFAYDVDGNSWSDLEDLPKIGRSGKKKGTKSGTSLACIDGKVYALKGGTTEFWVYSPDQNQWRQLDDFPYGIAVKAGGALTLAPEHDVLFALRGNKSLMFNAYIPSGQPGTPAGQFQPTPPGPNEALIASGEDLLQPCWNRAGDWVAFCRPDSARRYQIHKARWDGQNEQQLTSFNADASRPSWSPGDTLITFELEYPDSGYTQIAVVPASGGSVKVLTSEHCDHERPQWLVSGDAIVFSRLDTTSYAQLYSVPVQGGNEVALTNSPYDHEQPIPVSATEIVCQRDDDNADEQIYKLVRQGSTIQELPLTVQPLDHESPSVAFGTGSVTYQVAVRYAGIPAAFWQIGKASLQPSSTEQLLTSEMADFENPSYSPEGMAISCVRRSIPGSAVCMVNPDGWGYFQVTDDATDRENPNTTLNATCGITAAYERENGIYRTSSSAGGGQSSGILPVSLTSIAPNPAVNELRIAWHTALETQVSLKVYNATGRLVNTLVSGKVKPGAYVTVWNRTDALGRRLSAGVYFLKLETEGTRLERKLVLMD